MAEQKTGRLRNCVDKYYTKSSIAELCVNTFKDNITLGDSTIIEPSAGNGAFIPYIKKITEHYSFYDIQPESPLIIQQDYLKFKPDSLKIIHVIGNPPFGRQSSIALKFIQHSCTFASSVSFILPRSFKKDSIQKRIHPYFHLIKEIDLPDNSFLVNDKEFNVPCVFQIWKKELTKRINQPKLEPVNFEFVKKTENPDISFRRVGVNAGDISEIIDNKSIQSHYFIKVNKEKIKDLKNIIYNKNNTVGPKSISKQELIAEFNKVLI